MSQTAADREALMKTIKTELKQRLWMDPGARPTYGRYLSLFILNPEPMWVYDAETLQVLEVNDAAIQRYGYSRREFLSLTIKDLRPLEDVPKFLELTRELPNSDRTGPWRHRLKDATIIQVLITSHGVMFGDREARLVMAESPTLILGAATTRMHEDLRLSPGESQRQQRALSNLDGYLVAVQAFQQANQPMSDSF